MTDEVCKESQVEKCRTVQQRKCTKVKVRQVDLFTCITILHFLSRIFASDSTYVLQYVGLEDVFPS